MNIKCVSCKNSFVKSIFYVTFSAGDTKRKREDFKIAFGLYEC